MHHHPLLTFSLLPPTPKMPSSSSSLSTHTHTHTHAATNTTTKPRNKPSVHHNNHHNITTSPLLCRHHSISATATLDLLILILVLISVTFLLTSYFSYLFTSLSLILPSLPPIPFPPLSYLLGITFSLFVLLTVTIRRTNLDLFRPRRCGNPNCKGLKKALEFDLQLQTEDSLKPNNNNNKTSASAEVIEKLPWKGGTESNPDYECLRAELRKMAPPNGRAVLLFRAKCGCPVAKLVGWGPKKGRKHKKAIASTATNGDHR